MILNSLVTGGAGFIGSHVVRSLLKMGHNVVVLDDLSGGFKDQVPKDAKLIEGSILDGRKIQNVFKKYHFHYVYHLAAYAAEGLSHFIKNFNYQNNLIGSINLINASVNHDVDCFVFTSSIAVYGSAKLPMAETMQPEPEDSYGIAKLAVELELKATHQMFGLDYVIFRPHNVYGEHQNIGDPYRNVIGIFMNQIMQNKPMTIYGDGEQTRAFTYISDVAPIIAQSVNVTEGRNEVFNVGSDDFYTVNELAEYVSEAMGVPRKVLHLPPRNEIKNAYCSHRKLRGFFGDKPAVGLEEGLKSMVQWAKKTGARQSADYKSIEISKNLPLNWVRRD
jgi:UDP-glucose 4-epimerase